MMFRLRDKMHESGKGTWYSAEYTITPPGSFNVDFDYDNPPSFPFEPDPRTFYQDLQQYPRRFENAPEWLNEKIRSAIAIMKQEKEQKGSEEGTTG
ncbi:uncharacterized protein DUF600 [Nocardiopsis sp. Huas11]|nr:uncharacterized protein DUF600 [Nocardiopsis sp. Huas11]